jgi:hypothetical protein
VSPEPIYVFEKGMGWILTNPQTLKLRDCLVYLDLRVPELGERYTYFTPYDEYYLDENKNLKNEVLTREYKQYRLEDFSKYIEADKVYYRNQGFLDRDYKDTGKRIFVTFVQVSST